MSAVRRSRTPPRSVAAGARRTCADLAPYVPGKPIDELAREFGLAERDIVKLASNENPRGPSPAVRARDRGARPTSCRRYPDGNGFALKAALVGALRRRRPTQIVLGNGSNDILELVTQAFLRPGDRRRLFAPRVRRLSAGHAGARRDRHRGAGARLRARPAGDARGDHAGDAHRVRRQSRTIRPAPGSRRTRCEAFIASVPDDVLVVLDEAYNEYLEPAQQRAERRVDRERTPNLIVSRTFSKAYGLAGAARRLRDHERERRRHAEPRAPAVQRQRARAGRGAGGARRHGLRRREPRAQPRGHARSSRTGSRRSASRSCRRTATSCWCSVGDAARVYQRLLEQGVIVRPVANYGLPEWLRVTVGLPAENRRFLDALRARARALTRRAARAAVTAGRAPHRQARRRRRRARSAARSRWR